MAMFCLVKMQSIRVKPTILANNPQVIQVDPAVEKLECLLSSLLEFYLLELTNTPSFLIWTSTICYKGFCMFLS